MVSFGMTFQGRHGVLSRPSASVRAGRARRRQQTVAQRIRRIGTEAEAGAARGWQLADRDPRAQRRAAKQVQPNPQRLSDDVHRIV